MPPVQLEELYHHCPRCGGSVQPGLVFTCRACGLTLHIGPTAATAVYLRRDDGKWLFIRRAKEPAKGKLAPAGGFLDAGETAEAGAARELREEVGVNVGNLHYIGSYPNEYLYRDILYPVLDVFFHARAPESAAWHCPDEVEEILWLNAAEVNADDLAFPSMRAAWLRLRELVPD